MLTSSHIKNFDFINFIPWGSLLVILEVVNTSQIGIPKTEWHVFPPWNIAAIDDWAVAMHTSFWALKNARIVFSTKLFPVPPGAFKMNALPLFKAVPSWIHLMIVSTSWIHLMIVSTAKNTSDDCVNCNFLLYSRRNSYNGKAFFLNANIRINQQDLSRYRKW